MNTSYEVSVLTIQHQIARLEQEYLSALQEDKEFEQLKQIKISLNMLEEKFRTLVNTR
jgi:hypothetical protein